MTHRTGRFGPGTIQSFTHHALVAASLLLALGCGKDTTGPDGGDDQGTGGAGSGDRGHVIIRNALSGIRIGYVYAWRCGAQPNETDLLGPTETIEPGQDRAWDVNPGCYSVRILTLETPAREYTEEVTVESGRTQTLVIGQDDGGGDRFQDDRIQ